MKLKAYSVTDIGRIRKLNQDYVFTSEVPIGPLPNLFIVADGMGGHKAGEYASKCTVETIVGETNLSTERGPVRVISKAVRKANQRIRKKALSDDNYFGMGTTLVVATIDEDGLCVANVGDSRLYLISRGEIHQITVDHSWVEEMVQMGELERKNARNHPDKNIITRAIGVMDEVDVDFFEVDDISVGDIILMCSDGLSNMVEDTEILGIIESGGSIADRAKRLVAAANMNGGRDNIAVVLVELQK
ncbi:MAG: Stp1/IreP family PP2C-type Ser/Thr phosphatase [Lachnospiraceae bacterium]|nr:Stp1/IreP family PP2C-type Ser/Thr phosphatase [Lachnospiraceae bacterium]